MTKGSISVLAGALLSLGLVGQALAQASVTQTDQSFTVGTSAQLCVAGNGNRKTLAIQVQGANTIGYCFRNPATPNVPCTPVVGNAGTFTATNGFFYYWPYGSAPVNPIDCVGSAGGTVVSVSSGQ